MNVMILLKVVMKKYMVLVFETSQSNYEWEIIENENYANYIDDQAAQLWYPCFYSVNKIDIIYLANAYKWQKQYDTCKLLNAVPLNSLDDAVAYATHKVNELTSKKALAEIRI